MVYMVCLPRFERTSVFVSIKPILFQSKTDNINTRKAHEEQREITGNISVFFKDMLDQISIRHMVIAVYKLFQYDNVHKVGYK
jgi:hypothetical protein